jgi:hypothetical protein
VGDPACGAGWPLAFLFFIGAQLVIFDLNGILSMGANNLKQNSRDETGVCVGGIEPVPNHTLPYF